MEKCAFFFHGDSLLLPPNTPEDDPQIEKGFPLELSKDFKNPDIFEIPSVDNFPPLIITGVSVPETAFPPNNWKALPVRKLLSIYGANLNNKLKIENIIRACHIAQWRQISRFCGSCGAKNNDAVNSANQAQAQRICPKCGRTEFPRICPAVIVLITDDENRILLAHNKRFRDKVYSHISGFNEAGETLEETVAREIKEEVDIEVKDIEYIKSQPWPFPNSLMIGFKARYASGIIKPDGEEIEDAKWFTKDNLPELPAEGSLSRYIINNWLSGKL